MTLSAVTGDPKQVVDTRDALASSLIRFVNEVRARVNGVSAATGRMIFIGSEPVNTAVAGEGRGRAGETCTSKRRIYH